MRTGTTVDIGGGTRPHPGAWNLDPVTGCNPAGVPDELWRRRIQDGIPLDPNQAHAVHASHVFEHIPAGQERIDAMNEVHRVLIPGGAFEMVLPVIGYTDQDTNEGHVVEGWQAWADPTHVSAWWLPESWLYFTEEGLAPNAEYGVRLWQPLRREDFQLRGGWEARVVLHKPEDPEWARWSE